MPRPTALCLLSLLCTAAATRPTTRPATAPAKPTASPRVVFLLDASGSMMNRRDAARRELQVQLDLLTPDHLFNVAAFSVKGVRTARPGMYPATDANKRAVADFIEIQSILGGGTGDPVPARRTLRQFQPDEIWFFTDGDIPSWPALFAELATWRRRPRINTTLLVAADEFKEHLIVLARETGGVCLDADNKPFPADRPVTYRPPSPPPAKSPAQR